MLQGFWWFMTVSLSPRLGRPLLWTLPPTITHKERQYDKSKPSNSYPGTTDKMTFMKHSLYRFNHRYHQHIFRGVTTFKRAFNVLASTMLSTKDQNFCSCITQSYPTLMMFNLCRSSAGLTAQVDGWGGWWDIWLILTNIYHCAGVTAQNPQLYTRFTEQRLKSLLEPIVRDRELRRPFLRSWSG